MAKLIVKGVNDFQYNLIEDYSEEHGVPFCEHEYGHFTFENLPQTDATKLLISDLVLEGFEVRYEP